MESAVQQAICPRITRHNVQILDPDVRPPLANTVYHRHDDNAMALFVDIHPHIAIVRAGDRTHPRIGLVLPGVVCVPWLVVDFDEGLPLVELPKHLQELRPGYWLSRKASADIDNAAHNGDIARREV